MNNFYFLGDSICYGQYISVEKTWVYKFADWLNTESEYSTRNYTILNSSIIGNTTRDSLNRAYHEVFMRYPKVVYIQYGLNDCNQWDTENGLNRVMPKTFEANLEELIIRTKSAGALPIIGTNHCSNKNIDYDIRNSQYNNIIRTVANYNNIQCIDHESVWKTVDHVKFLLDDGIHLNECGHDLYFETIKYNIKL
jgi:lysophospholipase L1-like esterase